MSTYSNIKTQVVSILRTNITDAKAIYSYVERNPSGYPAINVDWSDGNAQFADTTRNRRKRILRITCMQERINVGPSEAERIMENMADQIIAVFDNRTNLSLNNAVDFALPIPSKWGYIQAPDIDVRTVEILLEANSLE
jgi:hypothetical protein